MSRKTAYSQLQTAATVSAATQTAAFPVDVANEVNIYLKVSAAGTTMTVNYQVSPNDGTDWFTHSSTAAITAIGNTLLKIPANAGKLARLDFSAVTGTFTVSSWFGAKRIAE
jgi:hypothetical protein